MFGLQILLVLKQERDQAKYDKAAKLVTEIEKVEAKDC